MASTAVATTVSTGCNAGLGSASLRIIWWPLRRSHARGPLHDPRDEMKRSDSEPVARSRGNSLLRGHFFTGKESSVASAFLFMGAKSVLGTTLPISGVNAAILVARFMHRFSGLLPHISNLMPWSQVVAGMLRMSYVTDVLRRLAVDYPITETIHKSVHTDANIMINSFQPDWFERFM